MSLERQREIQTRREEIHRELTELSPPATAPLDEGDPLGPPIDDTGLRRVEELQTELDQLNKEYADGMWKNEEEPPPR